MSFIKFMQPDPFYKALPAEVVVNTGQIVKIEPVWFIETPEGQRWRTYVGQPDEKTLEEGLQKEYLVYDSLGNRYNSGDATEAGRGLIEKMWREAM